MQGIALALHAEQSRGCMRPTHTLFVCCPQVVDVRRQQHSGAWFPHSLLASLQAQLAAAPQLHEVVVQLEAALRAHCHSAVEQSHMLEQRLASV